MPFPMRIGPNAGDQKSFEVLESLPTLGQPNDRVPLLSLGSFTRFQLEGCVQEKKSPDLQRALQINEVEQGVTKLPRWFGGLTAQLMFPGRGQISPVMSSFDSPNEWARSRRNDDNSNLAGRKKLFDLDIDRIGRGQDSRTTLVIKNIPSKYTSKMLLAAIDEGHRGTYDFVYLPIDFKKKCNVGYAFINMTDPSLIIPFYQAFNGKKWEKFNSEEVASLAYARIQGKAALVAHFQNSSLMNEDKRCWPILFNTDGPNAGDQKSFEVLESLPTLEQPNDCVPLLSLGSFTLEGCVQEEKSPDLQRVLQINGVEQGVTKLPRCLGGLTAQFIDGLSSSCGDERIMVSSTNQRDPHDASLLPLVNMDTDIHTASPQPIALPHSGEIVQLDSSEQKSLVDFDATNNSAYQSGVLLSSEKTNTIEECKGRWESLIQRTKKDMGEGLNGECLAKSILNLDDSTKRSSVNTRQGRGRLPSIELEQPATFAELGKDPENEGIVSDLLRFVTEKEFYKSVGKAWKRGYLLYDPPFTDRSSLMAYMANRLDFDIHDLDLNSLSSIEELTNVLVSIRNGSLIAIKDFDHWVGMLPNLKNELTLSGLLEIIHGLLSSCGDEQIIILTANHNHIDKVDAALLYPLNIDLYIHTSSPQPIAVPDGGEIMQLHSSERKPSVDFDATNNSACQSDVLVSNSEEKSTREASSRQCMPESVLSLFDSTTRISSMNFDAPDNSAHLVRAYQSGPIVCNSEKKDSGEGVNRECLTKSVLSLDDSSQQKSLPDVDATKNKAHLVIAYQKGLVVSLSENKNRGEALKRECITKSILGSEDLQQHSGGRRDAAAKNFCAIYDPGIHTIDSLARKSFEVLESLPTLEQPNDCVPLLSLGSLTLEGCVQEEKAPDLQIVQQINRVEQGVTKLPRYLGGLTAQKMVRKALKRKCRTWSVLFEIHQQHFGIRCEGAAKSFHATRICRKHRINRVSTVKRIHKQHGIHQWPFRQKSRKGYHRGNKRPFKLSSVSMDDELDSKLQFIHMSQFARSSPRPLAVLDGGEIVRPTALSSSEFAAANNIAQLVGQDQSSSTASHYEGISTRETSDKQGLTMSLFGVEDFQQHFGCKHKDAVKRLRVISMFKSTCRQHRVYWWLCQFEYIERQAFDATNNRAPLFKADKSSPTVSNSEKGSTREALKRDWLTNVPRLEDLRQYFGARRKDAAKGLGDFLSWKSFKVLESLPLGEQSNNITHSVRQRTLTHKHCVRQKISQDLPQSLQRYCSGGLAAQPAIGLPDGGHILSLSEKKIVGKTFKRKCRPMSVLSSEHHQQHADRRWEDAGKSLGAKRICRQLVIHHASTTKLIRRQHGIHRWPFQQNWETMKGYSLREERPDDVISSSTDGKLVSRLQLIHISWLGRFSPRPPALPPGGEIVGPLALSSSQLPSTSNRAQLVGQDQSGSTASHSEKKRTREPEGLKGTTKNFTIEDLQQYVGFKRADAAKRLRISESSFKRTCRKLGIERWPYFPTGEVWKPPDPHERNTRQIEMVNEVVGHLPEPIDASRPPDPDERNTEETEMENEIVRLLHEPNEFLQGFLDDPICWNTENGSTVEISDTPTIFDSMDLVIESGMENFEEARGSRERVFQVTYETTLSTAYPNPNLDEFVQPQVASTQLVSGNTRIPNDQRNSSASQAETRLEGYGTGSTCSNLALSQPMFTLSQMMPPFTSSEDTRSVRLKVYGSEIIIFQFPLTSGINELKGEVAMRLNLEQDSFNMKYEDDEGDKILISIDKDLRNYLSSSVNPVIKLWVANKVANPTN